MAFDWVEAVRLLHVLGAAVWFGGALLGIVVIGPAVKAAGPSGKAFMAAVMSRGGFARIMGPASGTTILAGLILYWQRGYLEAPFADTASTMVTVGGAIGLLVFIAGYAVGLPIQKRMMAMAKSFGPTGPSAEQSAQMEALGSRQARMGTAIFALVTLTFVLMTGRYILG